MQQQEKLRTSLILLSTTICALEFQRQWELFCQLSDLVPSSKETQQKLKHLSVSLEQPTLTWAMVFLANQQIDAIVLEVLNRTEPQVLALRAILQSHPHFLVCAMLQLETNCSKDSATKTSTMQPIHVSAEQAQKLGWSKDETEYNIQPYDWKTMNSIRTKNPSAPYPVANIFDEKMRTAKSCKGKLLSTGEVHWLDGSFSPLSG